MDDLLCIWKKDLNDVLPNGSPILDWIPAPMVETQPFTKCSWLKSNAPSTHMLHTPPIAPPPTVDDEPMDDAILGLDDEQSSDNDLVNGEVEYCPPDNDILVIAELDWAPIDEAEDQSDADEVHSNVDS